LVDQFVGGGAAEQVAPDGWIAEDFADGLLEFPDGVVDAFAAGVAAGGGAAAIEEPVDAGTIIVPLGRLVRGEEPAAAGAGDGRAIASNPDGIAGR